MLIIMLRKLQSNLNRSSSASIMNLQQKNICLEGWHLVLALLAALVRSPNVKVFLR